MMKGMIDSNRPEEFDCKLIEAQRRWDSLDTLLDSVNYLSKFLPKISDVCTIKRTHYQPSSVHIGKQHNEAFVAVQQLIKPASSAEVL